jgi:hypothetical protein
MLTVEDDTCMLQAMKVTVRRHWKDWQTDVVDLRDLEDLRWASISGGAHVPSPHPFIHGYVNCEKVPNVAHSGIHGTCPHRIKVCIVKKDQEPSIYRALLEIAGPKPKRS